MEKRKKMIYYPEYRLFTVAIAAFTVMAFVLSTPGEIFGGMLKIVTSRSILITDYMHVGGPGAMLVSAAITGAFAMLMMMRAGVKPYGAIIMALWMTLGFGLFGKNIFNMWPLMAGVWLYARVQKVEFSAFSLAALLVATLCPVVSEISFLPNMPRVPGLVLGVALGVLAGFIFPALASFLVRVHDGYSLYNMGFAGGLIAMFFVSILKSLNIQFQTETLWGTGYNTPMALLLYFLSVVLIAAGFSKRSGSGQIEVLRRIMLVPGRLVSDFYAQFGYSAYINMGILGILATTLVLVLGADLNGPTMGGVLTIIAFGCFGKHLRNVVPILVGAVLSTYLNVWDPTAPGNILAVLFSTGLAPIAGQFGIVWGIVAGFLHVNIVIHAGYLSNGLNLYNNGFAGGFVAMFLVPLIVALRRAKE